MLYNASKFFIVYNEEDNLVLPEIEGGIIMYKVLAVKIDHHDPLIRSGVHDYEILRVEGSFKTHEEAYEYIDDRINVLLSESKWAERLPPKEEYVHLAKSWKRKWFGVYFRENSTEYWFTIDDKEY